MKSLITVFIIFLCLNTFPQQDTLDRYGWKPAAVFGVNVSQVALSNWAQGGENALTWTFLGSGGLKKESEEWNFNNVLKITYGRTKIGSSEARVNDNELYIESVISKKIAWKIDPFFSNTIRTALAKGYDYKVEPFVEVANFFDPGFVTQSLGFTYSTPNKLLTSRLGFAVQEVFANKYRQYTDDPETPEIEAFKLETGLESVTSTEFNVMENMLYLSSLRLFSRFESMDVWDVRWDNTIVAKINNFFNVNLTWLVLYEKQLSPKTQLKEALQIGFTYILL